MYETIFSERDYFEEDDIIYRWSPTNNVNDTLDNPHVAIVDGNIIFYRDTCSSDMDHSIKETHYKTIDVALKRLAKEGKLIYEFERSVRTKEQKILASVLALVHDGKKIVVDTEDCYGNFYNPSQKICVFHCGMRKDCIRKKKDRRQRIKAAFSKEIANAIFRDIQNKTGIIK